MYVYADNAATTAMSQVAIDAMVPYFSKVFGNPSSLHSTGQEAKEALDAARATVAQCLGCEPREILFTSGGSEADNQAIVSAARFGARKGKKHIISTPFEHHAVLHTLQKLEKEGFEVTYLDVKQGHNITAQQVKDAIRPDTCLVTTMYANNEIGSVLPIAEIGAICKEAGVPFHTDAVQAVGHIVDTADGQQHMAGIQGAGGTGRAGRGADALVIQQKQQALALNALEAEIDVAGQTVDRVAVQSTVGDLAQPCNDPVPHSRDSGHIVINMVAGILHGSRHAADTGNVLGTGTLAPLLGTALDEVHQGEAAADIQGTDALGAVELVAGQTQHVNVLRLHIDLDVAHSLDRIGVEGNAGFLTNGTDLGDGQHGADFIVGVHGGHQAGIRPNGVLHLLGGDVVALAHVQKGHFKAQIGRASCRERV